MPVQGKGGRPKKGRASAEMCSLEKGRSAGTRDRTDFRVTLRACNDPLIELYGLSWAWPWPPVADARNCLEPKTEAGAQGVKGADQGVCPLERLV
jgi:hypothetical protein